MTFIDDIGYFNGTIIKVNYATLNDDFEGGIISNEDGRRHGFGLMRRGTFKVNDRVRFFLSFNRVTDIRKVEAKNERAR